MSRSSRGDLWCSGTCCSMGPRVRGDDTGKLALSLTVRSGFTAQLAAACRAARQFRRHRHAVARRSARRWRRCSPGSRIASKPGRRCEPRRSRTWRSTSAVNAVERDEARDVERHDEVAVVAGALVVVVEVDHVAPERRAVERAGKEAEHQRKPAALVAADRQQQAVGAARGSVSGRPSSRLTIQPSGISLPCSR